MVGIGERDDFTREVLQFANGSTFFNEVCANSAQRELYQCLALSFEIHIPILPLQRSGFMFGTIWSPSEIFRAFAGPPPWQCGSFLAVENI